MRIAIDRRTFLKAAASAVGVAITRPLRTNVEAGTGPIAIETPLSNFAYGDVQLHDGPMKRQFDENHAHYLIIDDDRLLKVFRQAAGLPAPGDDMGGWYDLTVENLKADRQFWRSSGFEWLVHAGRCGLLSVGLGVAPRCGPCA